MIDLQLHTTDSDGTWAWDRVLETCAGLALSAFAVTDHDTAVRRDDVLRWGEARGLLAIPGIELSTHENGQTVHLLGYFLDGPLNRLEGRLDFLRAARQDRNRKIILRLRELGCDVTDEEVLAIAGAGTIGRPHIARLLLQKGVVSSIKAAFDRYLAVDGAAYFPKEELPLREGIDLLHGAGAVTSIAHPILLNRPPEQMEASIRTWADWGLDALETYYPTYQPGQTAFMERMTGKYGLLMTGGSDFHGDNKPYIRIGVGTGNLQVPDELIPPLLERRSEIAKIVAPTADA